jgi:cytochrome c
MMFCRYFLAVSLIVGLVTTAFAADSISQDQVRVLTLKAATIVSSNDIDRVREIFHSPGEFRGGEIYVNVIDTNGTWLVYPPNPRNEGKSALNVRDQNGKMIVQEILKIGLELGEGWVEYQWLNPATNKIQPKLTYVKYVKDRSILIYIGIYKSD